MKKIFEEYAAHVNTDYAVELTRKLASFNFRVAGTKAQRDAADWIADEMKKINLQNVTRESFPIDSWGFKSATAHILEPEAFCCEGSTMVPLNGTDEEGVTAEVVYIGDGTKKWYDKTDVKGKIVFMDTNMFGDYWVNVLFEQAQHRGAAGIILTPVGIGPGTARDDICTIQTYLGGYLDIPAVMVSVADGNRIRDMLRAEEKVRANLRIDVDMVYGAKADYVYGMIPGRNPDRYIIIGGHFDAYYEGFNDNATSFGTQMAIARAVMESGYQPESTWIIITNGSEETGCQGTRADWLHGIMWAMKKHPEWIDNTIVFENIECTGLQDTTAYTICADNVYHDVMKEIFEYIQLPESTPDGLSVENIGTGADHILTSIEGIPSFMVKNTPTSIDGMTNREVYMNYYHTRIDDEEHADLKAMDVHNHIYGYLCLAFDQMAAAPMQFNGFLDFFWEETDKDRLEKLYPRYEELEKTLDEFSQVADDIYETIKEVNRKALCEKDAGNFKAGEIYDAAWNESRKLLKANKLIQKETHKFDNMTFAFMSHKQPYTYVTVLDEAICELEKGKPGESCEKVKNIYTNYLYVFDKEAYDVYAIDIFDEEKYLQYWYSGRVLKYPNMWGVLNDIDIKEKKDIADFSDEVKRLKKIREDQYQVLLDTLDAENRTFRKAMDILRTADFKKVFEMMKTE